MFEGEKCPGIGYGMGDVVLGLFLKAKGKMPKLEKEVEYFVVVIGDVYEDALRVVKRLRSEGKSVEISVSDMNTQKQLNYAQKINAKNLIFVGEEELKRGKFKVKNVYSGKESFWSF
jgi:histidyl-tRNA synthetase